MKHSDYLRLQFCVLEYTFGHHNGWQHCSGKLCSVGAYFAGIGIEDGRSIQGTFKSLCYSVSTQAWEKCFHICRHNTKPGFFPFNSWDLIRRFFHLSRSRIYWHLYWQNSSGLLRQMFALIGCSLISKKCNIAWGADVTSRW